MRRLRRTVSTLVFVAIVTGGTARCAAFYPPGPGKFRQEVPQPTAADLAALLAEPLPIPDREMAFALLLTPRLVPAGGAVRLTCLVPPSWGRGSIRLALEGVQASAGRIHYAETSRLIEGVPCGTWIASCATDTQQGVRVITQKLTARGLCNMETSDEPP